jgi:hypothetical protein
MTTYLNLCYAIHMFSSENEAKGYLAAIIDGEGHVSFRPTQGERRVIVTNTDLDILDAGIAACKKLGINARIKGPRSATRQRPNCAPTYDLVISGQTALRQLNYSILLRSTKKQQRLNAIINSYTTLPTNKIPVERLNELMLAEPKYGRLTRAAQELGITVNTLNSWLHRAGISSPPSWPKRNSYEG